MRNKFNAVASELCPFCGDEIDLETMSDFDYREWQLSRLCKRCMDQTFTRCYEDDYPDFKKGMVYETL